MQRLIPLVVYVLLSGCGGDNGENAPILHLRVNGATGGSVGQHRIERTGVISESGDGPAGGAVTSSQTVTVDKIADDAITVTVTMFDSDTGESSKQFLVPYDREITVAISDDTTAIARLERRE
ncbi:hypothetical protein [Novipirellula rosea]|uniref:Uncharacterized protein n=1 Tax=Novipirellula rosea TaxID=1031540 RepID=A0ABP8M4T9_9BACT